MSKEMAEMTVKFCGTVNMMFDALASAYSQLYKGTGCLRTTGCTAVGIGQLNSGTRSVFVETAKANIEQLLKGLGVC
jgi:roadblock/LC7 domain-containing protein